MARENIVKEWCDHCLRETSQRVEATYAEEFVVGNAKPRRIASCHMHYKKDGIEAFLSALTEYGLKADSAPQLPTLPTAPSDIYREKCPHCPRMIAPRGMTHHLSSAHPEVFDIKPAKKKQATCGVELADGSKCSYTKSPQAVGTHKLREHGISGSSHHGRRIAV